MRQLIMLLAALIFSGCTGYHAQVGPWSEPEVHGKTGMPHRLDNPWTQVGVCRFGPTLAYPVMTEQTCI